MTWPLRTAALVLAVAGVIPLANFITTGAPIGWWPSAVRQWLAWTTAVLVLSLVVSFGLPALVDRVIATMRQALMAPTRRQYAWAVALVTCALAVYFGRSLFGAEPIVGDEFAQRWQAQLLASGRLFAKPEQHPEFFSTIQALDTNNRWFSQFPVGGPAMLAIGVLFKVPWLVNPVFAGIAVAAFFMMMTEIGDELTARGAALLFATSPFIVFMAGSQMNHVPALAWIMIALAALARWHRTDNAKTAIKAAALVGVALGVSATIRPFDAAIVAFAVGVFQLRALAAERWKLKSVLVQVAACAVPIGLLLLVNWITLGHPFEFAYDVLNGVEHRPGFHMTPLGFEHTPRRGLYNVSAYLLRLNVAMFAWPVPVILIVVFALACQRRADAWDSLFLGILALILIGYTTYWSLSIYLGPRFLYVIAPLLLVYIARFPGAVHDRLRIPGLRRAVLLVLPLCMVMGWAVPRRENGVIGAWQLTQIYRSRGTAAPIRAAVARAQIAHAVVFIQEGWHARLAARLRALTFRPLFAEQVVKESDACFLQRTITTAEAMPPNMVSERINLVVRNLRLDVLTTPMPGLQPSEQIAFVSGRPLAPVCEPEVQQVIASGASLAEMLPYETYDSSGRLTGDIIYARDFGARNEVLRERFGDRQWFVARLSRAADSVKVVLEPYTKP